MSFAFATGTTLGGGGGAMKPTGAELGPAKALMRGSNGRLVDTSSFFRVALTPLVIGGGGRIGLWARDEGLEMPFG